MAASPAWMWDLRSSGGVFVISGARVKQVTTAGAVTTYGQNDMVLDNWGTVITWTATGPVEREVELGAAVPASLDGLDSADVAFDGA